MAVFEVPSAPLVVRGGSNDMVGHGGAAMRRLQSEVAFAGGGAPPISVSLGPAPRLVFPAGSFGSFMAGLGLLDSVLGSSTAVRSTLSSLSSCMLLRSSDGSWGVATYRWDRRAGSSFSFTGMRAAGDLSGVPEWTLSEMRLGEGAVGTSPAAMGMLLPVAAGSVSDMESCHAAVSLSMLRDPYPSGVTICSGYRPAVLAGGMLRLASRRGGYVALAGGDAGVVDALYASCLPAGALVSAPAPEGGGTVPDLDGSYADAALTGFLSSAGGVALSRLGDGLAPLVASGVLDVSNAAWALGSLGEDELRDAEFITETLVFWGFVGTGTGSYRMALRAAMGMDAAHRGMAFALMRIAVERWLASSAWTDRTLGAAFDAIVSRVPAMGGMDGTPPEIVWEDVMDDEATLGEGTAGL